VPQPAAVRPAGARGRASRPSTRPAVISTRRSGSTAVTTLRALTTPNVEVFDRKAGSIDSFRGAYHSTAGPNTSSTATARASWFTSERTTT